MQFITRTHGMTTLAGIEGLITRERTRRGAGAMELLAQRVQLCAWNQIFMASDIRSRRGATVLHSLPRFPYMVSLSSTGSKAVCQVASITAAEGILWKSCN